MNQYDDIRKRQTTYGNVHESVYRAHHVLQKAKELLAQGVPSHIVLELIEMMEDDNP